MGVLKAALSFYWPSIGEWRYDDLHASLRYHESCRVKQLLVNALFFVVYPFVLCGKWYASNRWKFQDQTDGEWDIFEQYVEYTEEEAQLLRNGMLRGRMIIQTEIVLTDPADDDDQPSYKRYDEVDDEGVVGVETKPMSNGEDYATKCEPLNLSKDADDVAPSSDGSLLYVSSEEEANDDRMRLIQPSLRTSDGPPSSSTGANNVN
uniref:Uncharacterized protein n=1 Tax=Anopheles farauti TaxID=69004 RepID=A0A182QEA0_9DIPT